MTQTLEAIDFAAIQRMLPHRYPFLLIDRVLSCEPGECVTALKNVTANEEFFQGHFPGNPVMPGVLMLEALAQTCGVLASKTANTGAEDGVILLFAGIDKARFKRQVIPGDQLILSGQLTKRKRDIWCFSAEARVDEQLACRADLLCAIHTPA
ncbi:(3R)-hydroxymyristoyl-ACP dehydratase [Oceanococcus atlanticus]|uniref:3-hydroxyacyl-[acyl-carrier-protein] dehydratase FabZ n=1 Tax=Oceanococcus atlanticus TaxID=1317117 RepID=A0A1Y1SDF0_9GAMM|nr:3-hydroxyacyl-ACP dehydratase FabZ [Oceanococcus atlanticus]ORE87028.1 (3R)-hydroxymyristoyl-ACP dehydratase [Oceanococcus atlanticus]